MPLRAVCEIRMHRQRGAVAVLAAVSLLGMFVSLLLVIEMGRIYLADRQLDKLASFAALDSARLLSGCGSKPTLEEVQAAVNSSLARNMSAALTLKEIEIELGRVGTDHSTGLRSLSPTDLAKAEAVRIRLTAPMPELLTGFLPVGDRVLTASATALQPAVGSFAVGSGIAKVDAQMLNAVLTALGGGSVNFTAVDYERLSGVRLSVELLATAFGLTVKDLSDPLRLETETLLLGDALNGLANAVGQTAHTEVVTLLRLLASAANDNARQLSLADVLGAVPDEAPAVPYVNLLDLVMALEAASRADEEGRVTPVAVPLTVSIPRVSNLHVFLQVLSPAQPSGFGPPGRTSAQTAAVRVLLRMQLDARDNIQAELDSLLSGMGQVTAPPFNVGLDLELARAVAYLDALGCPTLESGPVARLSAQPALGRISAGTFTGAPQDAPPLTIGLVQILQVRTDIVGGLIAQIRTDVFLDGPAVTQLGAGGPQPLPLDVTEFTGRESTTEGGRTRPYWEADRPVGANPQIVGSTELLSGGLGSLASSLNLSASDPERPDTSSEVCLLATLCVPVSDILDAVLRGVRNTTDPVLTQANALDQLLSETLGSLGIEAGTATVTMEAASIAPPYAVSKNEAPTAP